MILEWQTTTPGEIHPTGEIDFKRIDLTTASPPGKKPAAAPIQAPVGKLRKDKPVQSKKPAAQAIEEVHLRAADTAGESNSETSGTVDTTIRKGDTYSYTAQKIRSIRLGGRILEIQSELSLPVTVTTTDTFPPRSPTGLATISGDAPTSNAKASAGPYVDLSWEPNSEADLAGYRVYRQLARPDGSPQGPLARLTALPIAVPAFRDVAVRAGQGYIYSVTAVDAAGNESAPSAKALEVIQPPN